jgi:hypothetical protein
LESRLQPVAVVIGPDRISIEEDIHGEPDPSVRALDFALERDADFAQKVPSPVAVAGVGPPEVPGTKVAVHLLAADLHHLAADLAFFRSQQIVDEGVSPGEVVGVGHPRLVVVPVAGRSERIPLGAVQQDNWKSLGSIRT